MKKTWVKNLLVLILLSGIFTWQTSTADTVSELQAKIKASNDARAELEKEISKYQGQLKEISTEANSLQNSIKTLDVSTNKITTEVKLTQNNISKTSYTIEDTGLEIKDKERTINLGNKAIKETLRQIAEADSMSIWEILLSNRNISDFWVDVESTIQVQAKIGAQIDTVKEIKDELEVAKKELEIRKIELEKYTKELANQKVVLDSTKKEKSSLLAVTKNKEANYQKLLDDKLALKEALDREVASFESQLRLTIDPQSFPPSGKGILSWPLDNVYITQNFGVTAVSGRLYKSGSHNGTDFRAPIGTRVKSAGTGTVEGLGDTDTICRGASFGKWVFIRYDNGLASSYGHLSSISAYVGQRVKAGDVVAYSGSTGYSTGPHLHMSVYAGQGVKVSTLKSAVCNGTYTIPLADPNAYLDPLAYL